MRRVGRTGRLSGRGLLARVCVVCVLGVLTAACGTTGGRYYEDDGPPRFRKGPDPSSVRDAVPRNEPLARTGNSPYTALGQRFTPMRDARGFRQVGYASWYGRKYHGNRTSSGEIYDMYAMTAAHPTLPLPSYVRVRNLDNGRTVVVKVNDRGPFLRNRVIDLSYMAARKLGVVASGVARVELETVFAGDAPAEPRRRLAGPPPVVPAPSPAVAVSTLSSTPVAARETFVLQAGSFASRDNAERLLHRLRGGGYENVRIQRVKVSGRDYHRVQIGPYASRDSANVIATTLRQYLKAPVSVVMEGSG